MYLLIPLIIFLSSVLIITWIIIRKFVFLRKLTSETLESSSTDQEGFWAELFPELITPLKKIKFREWGITVLAEFEKFLRKLRLVSLKIDAFTNQLIHKVRRTTARQEEVLSKEAETAKEETSVAIDEGDEKREEKNWKEEEQKLIIEIAKNPKDAELYKKLGWLYLKIGENQDAYESFKKALELDPGDDRIRVKLEKLAPGIKK